MKVIKNEVKPVVTPPATYDIIGLTEKEAKVLLALCGNSHGRIDTDTNKPNLVISNIFDHLRNQRIRHKKGWSSEYFKKNSDWEENITLDDF